MPYTVEHEVTNAPLAAGEVALNAPSSAVNGSAIQLLDITTYTVGSGENRALIGCITHNNTVTGLTATWDNGASNQSMTLIGTQKIASWNQYISWFGLVAPVSGNKTLRYAWTTAVTARAFCVDATGVDQTGGATSFSNYTGNSGSAGTTAALAAMTVPTGGIGISGLQVDALLPITGRSHTTLLDSTAAQPVFLTQQTAGATGSIVMSFTDDLLGEWGVNGFVLEPA